MSRASSASPDAASMKARVFVGRSGGRTNPSVNIEDPLISNARSKLRTPSAWNIIVNAAIRIVSQTSGSTSRPIGA